MMNFIKAILFVSLSLLLVACTSNHRITFYLLRAIEPVHFAPHQDNSQLTGITVLVKPAIFPEYLDRPQMVVRESQYKHQILEQHRWAESLKYDFTRVFTENLDTRIVSGSASVYSKIDKSKPDYQLSIEVLQMDVNMNDQAVLRVDWSLLTGKKAKLIKRQNSKFSLPVENNSHESGVEAQSKAIALLADEIAESIRTLQKQSVNEL